MSDISTAFFKMIMAYEMAFSSPENRERFCPIKEIHNLKWVDGASVERQTRMMGTTISGNYGEKDIYVNDETHEYRERVYLTIKGREYIFNNEGITTFRCGIMTALAIHEMSKKMMLDFSKVGFIGCGRTNQMNCRAITEMFQIGKAVIRGSDNDRAKNLDKFKRIVRSEADVTDEMMELNQCDIVVVTTSNFDPKNLISTKQLYGPRLLIVLDCGYTLDESFRKECSSYTDYKEQILSDYDDEFPFDKEHYELKQMAENKDSEEGRVCVYLHGIGFADIMVAEMKAKGMIE